MVASAFSRRHRPRSVSALALAVGLAHPLHAQSTAGPSSYNAGAPTVASGSVSSNFNTPGTDIYTVGTATAVLDFTPTDTATNAGAVIDFQNAGTQAIYRSTPGGPAFTLLNRIVPVDPSRPIAFNGRVAGQLVNSTGVTSTGGSVWFYSPGGIVVADGSVFDVGSLLLSTADPTGGSGTIGSTSDFFLDSSANPNGIVNVLSGGTINAVNASSYIALVAPIVFQRGRINVNGAAAFVAAEQASLTFDQGLFDINVAVGSSAAGGFPLQLRGTVNLDKSSGATTNNRGIYAVAIPKNSAVSMIVAPDGFYGFDIANGATIQNGAVYLQAGGNLTVDPSAPTRGQIQELPTSANANISIEGSSDPSQLNGGRFTAPVGARAGGRIDVDNSSNALSFASDAAFYGGSFANLHSTVGTIRVGGDLDIFSFGQGSPGTVTLNADGGSVDVTGTLTALGGVPGNVIYNSTFTINQGGNTQIGATAGGVIHAARISVGAQGTGDASVGGLGGFARIGVDGGTVRSDGDIDVYAGASSPTAGIAAAAGSAEIDVANGNVRAGQAMLISASANTGANAVATGGQAQLVVRSNGSASANTIQISAGAQGGDVTTTGSGGDGMGGLARIVTLTTTGIAPVITSADTLFVQADGRGGNGGSGTGSAGGMGTAGTAIVDLVTGARLTANVAFMGTFGSGGTAGSGAAGNAFGGTTRFTTAGIVDVGALLMNADAAGGNRTGGAGDAGGAYSGNAQLSVTGGSFAATRNTGSTSILSGVSVSSTAVGGAVTGGSGTGGTAVSGGAFVSGSGARIGVLNDAALAAARLASFASATGGAGLGAGDGGTAAAGVSSVILSTSGAVAVDTVTIRANATGGAGPGGTGGHATGNTAEFLPLPSGPTAIAGAFAISSDATGGNGRAGGDAEAGLVNLLAGSDQPMRFNGAATFSASAIGGSATAGNGGAARGGSVRARFGNGGLTAFTGPLNVTASATGGTGVGAGFDGGAGTGGGISWVATTGTATVTGDAILAANAIGGTRSGSGAGSSGDATGGGIEIAAYEGSLAFSGFTQLNAPAFVRVSQNDSGDAVGGTVRVVSEPDPDGGPTGTGTVTMATLVSDLSAAAGEATGTVGNGGNATGGSFTLLADAGPVALGDVNVFVSGSGFGGDDPATNTISGGTIMVEARNADLTLNSGSFSATASAPTIVNALPPRTAGAGVGGSIAIRAGIGHRIDVAQSLSAGADGVGGRTNEGTAGVASSGTGGTVLVDATGTITTGTLFAEADGFGGGTFAFDGATGGAGIGGTVDITVTGRLSATDGINGSASGRGGSPEFFRAGNGGSGIGGLVRLRAMQGGAIETDGAIGLVANGTGSTAGSLGGTGGAGIGGRTVGTQLGGAYLLASGGTITGTTGFFVSADGNGGGSGGTLQGGAGTGGQAWIVALNGIVDLSAGDSNGTLSAIGLGGADFASFDSSNAILAGGGTGGTGTGGQVLIGRSNVGANAGFSSTSTGRILLGDVNVDAYGQGGRGAEGAPGLAGGTGGTGVGGAAEVSADAAFGRIFATGGTTLAVDVDGIGGLGGTGGDLVAGGSAGAGGTGGLGTGGSAVVGTTNDPSSNPTTGAATFANLALSADGIGGDGGSAVTTAGVGGAGRGGSLSFGSRGAPVIAANVGLLASGTGGTGGENSVGATAADGDATGGTAAVLATARTSGLSRGSLTQSGVIAVDTSAMSSGGATVAGTSSLDVISGDAAIGTYFVTNAGATPSATGTSRINATDGTLTATAVNVEAIGDLALTTGTGGAMNLGTALLQATRSLTFGSATVPSNVPGAITVTGDLTVIVGGDYSLGGPSAAGGVYSVTAGGAIATGAIRGDGGVAFAAGGTLGTGAVTSNGSIALAARGGGIATGALQAGRSVVLLAAGDVATGAITTGTNAGDVTFVSNIAIAQTPPVSGLLSPDGFFNPAFNYTSLASVTPQRLNGIARINGATRTGNFLVAASGGVTAGALDVNTRILIDSGAGIALGNVTIPAALALQADGTITTGSVQAQSVSLTSNTGDVVSGALTASGDIGVISRVGRITTGNAQAGGNIALLGKTGITTGALSARRTGGGYVLLADAANAGAIAINGAVTAMGGALSIGGPVSADIIRTAATGATSFAGVVDAASLLRVSSGDLSLGGNVSGTDIRLASTNLRLGANASLGNASTTTLALSALGVPAVVGGADANTGYVLDSGEISRIRAGSIDIGVGNDVQGTPALTIRDASFTAGAPTSGANLTGTNGTLLLSASGTVSILGNLALTGAGSGQSLVLIGDTVRLTNDVGSIAVTNNGALAGRLSITGRRIEAGSAQLLGGSLTGTLSAATSAAIGAAAAQPRQEGYIQAGRIELAAVDNVIIQNSGSATLAAGFSAGVDGLSITNSGGTQTGGFIVLVYGRIQGASGFITNNDTVNAVSFASNGGTTSLSGYSTQSVVNGCTFVPTIRCGSAVTESDDQPPVAVLVRDVIDGSLIAFSRDTIELPTVRAMSAIDAGLIEQPALVSDPFASAGNPSLWGDGILMLAPADRSATPSAQPAGPATGKKQDDSEDRPKRPKRKGER